jgi:FdhD protein
VTARAAIAPIRRIDASASLPDQDLVAVEAPLALIVEQPSTGVQRALGLLMRTPGDDIDLVRGLLYCEGVITRAGDVLEIATEPSRDDRPETATAILGPEATAQALPDTRALAGTSACGLCGRLGLPRASHPPRPPDAPMLSARTIAALPDRLRQAQAVFDETGGLHAAAIFDADGTLQLVREDVGRHNAVDKAIGALLERAALPATRAVIVVSGRVAFEIVQKASAAGVAAVVAVGAPSSLAVAAARAASLTLIGFARGGRFNVYAGEARLKVDRLPDDQA